MALESKMYEDVYIESSILSSEIRKNENYLGVFQDIRNGVAKVDESLANQLLAEVKKYVNEGHLSETDGLALRREGLAYFTRSFSFREYNLAYLKRNPKEEDYLDLHLKKVLGVKGEEIDFRTQSLQGVFDLEYHVISDDERNYELHLKRKYVQDPDTGLWHLPN